MKNLVKHEQNTDGILATYSDGSTEQFHFIYKFEPTRIKEYTSLINRGFLTTKDRIAIVGYEDTMELWWLTDETSLEELKRWCTISIEIEVNILVVEPQSPHKD